VSARANVRSNMVNGAVRLLATEGVEGTSFKEVLALSDAPRGSVYHHFPGGKSELLHEALNRTSELSLALLEPVRGQPVEVVLERFIELWRQLLERSNLTAGCAIAAITVAGPETELLEHAGEIFRVWTDRLAELFVVGGMEEAAAHQLSNLAIAATEGAVIMARAERSMDPFEEVASAILHNVRGKT
jgi:TetR/AcrR family transcriptional regulator, lmrAB and yxaGH operons repressor